LFQVVGALDGQETGGHGELIVLAPILVGLLCAAIVIVTVLGRRGVIGPLGALVETDVALVPIVVGLSLGAGAIHAAVIGDHFAEFWLFGLFFTGAAVFQLVWPIAWWRDRGAWLAIIGIVLNGATIVLWLWSRLVGLPIGPTPGAVEHIGFADLLATLFEAAIVGVLVARRRSRPPAAAARRCVPYADAAIARTFSILAIAVLTAAAIVQLGGRPT